MSALLVAFATRRLRVEGETMRRTKWKRSVTPVSARVIAFLVLLPVLTLGVATAFSSGGSAGAATSATANGSNGYSGGMMMAADPIGGYWTVTPAGAVTPHSSAPALGSPALSNLHLSRPVVGMAGTPDGNGYWLVASDGGIFNYGDATFYGSTGGMHLNKPIVGMASTNDGKGYWLVASDGGIFSYGDADLLRLDGRPPPQQAHRRHGGHHRRQRLLAHRLRRRHLQLRRRRLLRLDRRPPPEPADHRAGSDP